MAFSSTLGVKNKVMRFSRNGDVTLLQSPFSVVSDSSIFNRMNTFSIKHCSDYIFILFLHLEINNLTLSGLDYTSIAGMTLAVGFILSIH